MGNNSITSQNQLLKIIQHQHLGHLNLTNYQNQQCYLKINSYGDPYNFQEQYSRLQIRMKRFYNHSHILKIIGLDKQQSHQLCSYGGKIKIYLEKFYSDVNGLLNKKIQIMQHFTQEQIWIFLRKVVDVLITIHDNGLKTIMIDTKSILICLNQQSNHQNLNEAKIKIIDGMICKENIYQKILMGLTKQEGENFSGVYFAPQLLRELKNSNAEPCFSPKLDVFSLGMLTVSMCCLESMDCYYDYSTFKIDYQSLIHRICRMVYSDQLKKILAQMLQADQQQRIGLVSLQQKLNRQTSRSIAKPRSSSTKMLTQLLSSSRKDSRKKLSAHGISVQQYKSQKRNGSIRSHAQFFHSHQNSEFQQNVTLHHRNLSKEQNLSVNSQRNMDKMSYLNSNKNSSLQTKRQTHNQDIPIESLSQIQINNGAQLLRKMVKKRTNVITTIQSNNIKTFFNKQPTIDKQNTINNDNYINKLRSLHNSELQKISKRSSIVYNQQIERRNRDDHIHYRGNINNNNNLQHVYNNQQNITAPHNSRYNMAFLNNSRRNISIAHNNNNNSNLINNNINNNNRLSHYKKSKEDHKNLNFQDLESISHVYDQSAINISISRPQTYQKKQKMQFQDLSYNNISQQKFNNTDKHQIIDSIPATPDQNIQSMCIKPTPMKPFEFLNTYQKINSNNFFNDNQFFKKSGNYFRQTQSIQKNIHQNNNLISNANNQCSNLFNHTNQINFNKKSLKQDSYIAQKIKNTLDRMYKTAKSINNSQQKDKIIIENDKSNQNKGYQKIILKNGYFYEGQTNSDGEMEGNGVLYDQEQKIIYSGSWLGGKFHAFGTLYSDNEKQTKSGNYLNLESEGWNKYEGEFFKGERHGFGTLYYPNGQKFSGCMKFGVAEGYGCYYLKSGQLISGLWKSNQYRKL